MSYNRDNRGLGRLHIYTNNNVTTTPIAVANTYYPILFTSTPAIYNYGQTVATNSFTYNGQSGQFHLSITGNMNKVTATNVQIAIAVFKNGTIINESEINFFGDDTEQHIFATQTLVNLTSADVITVRVKNVTNTNTVTITSINLIIE